MQKNIKNDDAAAHEKQMKENANWWATSEGRYGTRLDGPERDWSPAISAEEIRLGSNVFLGRPGGVSGGFLVQSIGECSRVEASP